MFIVFPFLNLSENEHNSGTSSNGGFSVAMLVFQDCNGESPLHLPEF